MAITKQKKEEILAKVEGIVGEASTIVFANFKGLTVAEANELRRGLRAASVGYTVAKKTLIHRALAGLKLEGAEPVLEGEIALAYGKDELAPARELAPFIKKFPEHLAFAGGVFAGRYVDAQEIRSIAAIPPLQTLRAQFVHVINSPIQKLAVVLDQIAQKRSE